MTVDQPQSKSAPGQPGTTRCTSLSPAGVTEKLSGKQTIATNLSCNLSSYKNERVVSLIGRKALIQCYLNRLDINALLDTGAQVRLIVRDWKNNYFPSVDIQPLTELLSNEEDSELHVYALNGNLIPFDGWVQ